MSTLPFFTSHGRIDRNIVTNFVFYFNQIHSEADVPAFSDIFLPDFACFFRYNQQFSRKNTHISLLLYSMSIRFAISFITFVTFATHIPLFLLFSVTLSERPAKRLRNLPSLCCRANLFSHPYADFPRCSDFLCNLQQRHRLIPPRHNDDC